MIKNYNLDKDEFRDLLIKHEPGCDFEEASEFLKIIEELFYKIK